MADEPANGHPKARLTDDRGNAIPQLKCPNCDGSKRVADRDGGGWYFVDCPACHGTGTVPDMATNARAVESAAAKQAAAPPAP